MDIKEEAKALARAAAECGAEQFGELILQAIVGTAAPGVMNAVLAYKQKRQEKMYSIFLQELARRMDTINERLGQLSAHSLLDFREKYFGMISDYALEEVQEEKIVYIANGLTNLAGVDDPKEDLVLSYYDTLLELRLLDIAVLKNFYALSKMQGKSYPEMLETWGIDQKQYFIVRSKLERMGLIESDRDENNDRLRENVALLQTYMENLNKGNKPRSTGRFKTVSRHENYRISSYGRSFLEFFQ